MKKNGIKSIKYLSIMKKIVKKVDAIKYIAKTVIGKDLFFDNNTFIKP
jgi:hypothetical protein